jgi:hypothetical protein
MEALLIIFGVIAAVLQIVIIVSFFSMNTKLGNIEHYLYLQAAHSGAVQETATSKRPATATKGQPWMCPQCKHTNAYWDEACANCGKHA